MIRNDERVKRRRSWAALCALIGVASPVFAVAQKAPESAKYRDVWHLETGKSDVKSPRGLAVTGDCTLWFVDDSTGVFRLGCTARTPVPVGALGSKEGEYREPWLISRASGDSVIVYDRNRERALLFAGDGKFSSTSALNLSAGPFADVTTFNAADGTIRLWESHFPSANDPEALPSLVVRLRAGGKARDTLATIDGISSVYWGSAFSGSHIPVPASRHAAVAFARDGGFIAGYTNEERVVVRDSSGREVRRITLSLPAPTTWTKADRNAFADSVHRYTDAEMEARHYEKVQRAQYRAQIEQYVKEDAPFPELRQLYDRLVLDASEQSVWVLLPGTGKNYARTWEVHSMTDGALERRVTVPHKGAVVDAAVKDGVLYTVEKALGGLGRVAKYTP